jgi:hypothetical protein
MHLKVSIVKERKSPTFETGDSVVQEVEHVLSMHEIRGFVPATKPKSKPKQQQNKFSAQEITPIRKRSSASPKGNGAQNSLACSGVIQHCFYPLAEIAAHFLQIKFAISLRKYLGFCICIFIK